MDVVEDSDSNVKRQFSRALSTVTKSAKKTKDAAKIEKYFYYILRYEYLFDKNQIDFFLD